MELIKGLPKKDTYTMALRCYNCGQESKYEIPRGTLLIHFDTVCSYCGCSRKAAQGARTVALGPSVKFE